MKFASEEARIEAMNALDPLDPESAEKQEEYIAAEIGPDEGGDKPPEGGTKPPEDGTKPIDGGEKPPEAPHDENDLKGYSSRGELLKAFDNLKDLTARQAEKIREFQANDTSEIQQRLETAERELAELRRTPSGKEQAKETKADMTTLKAARQKITEELDALDREAEEDPDVVFNPDYQKRLRKANRDSIANTAEYDAMFERLNNDLSETRRVHTEYVENQNKAAKNKEAESHYADIFTQLDSLNDPEYKTTKPTRQLMHEYLDWRTNVATAYYGRPPKSDDEAVVAMHQLELGNPELMKNCEIRGTPTAPDEDMKRYIKKTELNLYRQGYRRNPSTGRFDAAFQLKDASGKPIEHPSISAALAAMRQESGYYKKKEESAYQMGAESLANSMQRRDQGALTMDGSDQKLDTKTVQWAEEYLQKIDPDMVRMALERKDHAALKDYYEAMKILGVPISV